MNFSKIMLFLTFSMLPAFASQQPDSKKAEKTGKPASATAASNAVNNANSTAASAFRSITSQRPTNQSLNPHAAAFYPRNYSTATAAAQVSHTDDSAGYWDEYQPSAIPDFKTDRERAMYAAAHNPHQFMHQTYYSQPSYGYPAFAHGYNPTATAADHAQQWNPQYSLIPPHRHQYHSPMFPMAHSNAGAYNSAAHVVSQPKAQTQLYNQKFYDAWAILHALDGNQDTHKQDKNKTLLDGAKQLIDLKRIIFDYLKINEWHNTTTLFNERHNFAFSPSLAFSNNRVALAAYPNLHTYNLDNQTTPPEINRSVAVRMNEHNNSCVFNDTYMILIHGEQDIQILDIKNNARHLIKNCPAFALHATKNILATTALDGIIQFNELNTHEGKIILSPIYNFKSNETINSIAFIAPDMIAASTRTKKLIVWQLIFNNESKISGLQKISGSPILDTVKKITPAPHNPNRDIVFATSSEKTSQRSTIRYNEVKTSHYFQIWKLQKNESGYCLTSSQPIVATYFNFATLTWITSSQLQQPLLVCVQNQRVGQNLWNSMLRLWNHNSSSQAHEINLTKLIQEKEPNKGNLYVHAILFIPTKNMLIMALNEGFENCKTVRVWQTTGDILTAGLNHRVKAAAPSSKPQLHSLALYQTSTPSAATAAVSKKPSKNALQPTNVKLELSGEEIATIYRAYSQNPQSLVNQFIWRNKTTLELVQAIQMGTQGATITYILFSELERLYNQLFSVHHNQPPASQSKLGMSKKRTVRTALFDTAVAQQRARERWQNGSPITSPSSRNSRAAQTAASPAAAATAASQLHQPN